MSSPDSPPVPDTCIALFNGDTILLIALATTSTNYDYCTSFALFQLVAFFLAFLVLYIYRPPTGSIEEITGPNCRQFQNAESFGKLLCFTIALWSLWWFWQLIYRFIPLCAGAFGFTLHYSCRWIIGIPSIIDTRFPPITPRKELKDMSLYKDSAV